MFFYGDWLSRLSESTLTCSSQELDEFFNYLNVTEPWSQIYNVFPGILDRIKEKAHPRPCAQS